MGGLIGLMVTISHMMVSLFVAFGILFTKTPEGAFFIMLFLIVLLLLIRKFNGCVVTHSENPLSMTSMGMAFAIKKDTSVTIPEFEEIGVGVCLFLQSIRLLTLLLVPADMVLE
jgi:hypothetical protein